MNPKMYSFLKEQIMYECMKCGEKFAYEKASKKPTHIYLHGNKEPEDCDCCPFCGSEWIADVEEDEEEQ